MTPQVIQDWHNKRYDVVIDGQRCKFKSKFEYRWALYLQQLVELGEIVSWEYELYRFWFEKIRQGVRGYTPDFKVVLKGNSPSKECESCPTTSSAACNSCPHFLTVIWHETKVHLVAKDITKYHRMQIYYPDEKLILVMDRRKGKRAKRKQVNALEAANKYTHRIIYANEISLFKQIKVD